MERVKKAGAAVTWNTTRRYPLAPEGLCCDESFELLFKRKANRVAQAIQFIARTVPRAEGSCVCSVFSVCLVFLSVVPSNGVFAAIVTHGGLPFWLRWWFPLACVGVGLAAASAVYRLRLHQAAETMNQRFEERLTERMRIAQDLHDTLLQGVISASMQLDVAVDRLPPGSPAQPALVHIVKTLDQVIEEGRTTLRRLRSAAEDARELELAFLRASEELGADGRIAYRVRVMGSPLPLQTAIHEEVYSIGREALANAFRYSGASSIEVELDYTARGLRVSVRDNGCGIKSDVLRAHREGRQGLSGMRERAQRIGANFRIVTDPSGGTEVDLSVPGHIVFQVPRSNRRWGWLSKARLRLSRVETLKVESELRK